MSSIENAEKKRIDEMTLTQLIITRDSLEIAIKEGTPFNFSDDKTFGIEQMRRMLKTVNNKIEKKKEDQKKRISEMTLIDLVMFRQNINEMIKKAEKNIFTNNDGTDHGISREQMNFTLPIVDEQIQIIVSTIDDDELEMFSKGLNEIIKKANNSNEKSIIHPEQMNFILPILKQEEKKRATTKINTHGGKYKNSKKSRKLHHRLKRKRLRTRRRHMHRLR